MSKYIPPNIKENLKTFEYKPVKLNLNVDIKLKSQEEIFEKERQKDYGKADAAWGEYTNQ